MPRRSRPPSNSRTATRRWRQAPRTWSRPSRRSGRSARPRSPAADGLARLGLQPDRKLDSDYRKRQAGGPRDVRWHAGTKRRGYRSRGPRRADREALPQRLAAGRGSGGRRAGRVAGESGPRRLAIPGPGMDRASLLPQAGAGLRGQLRLRGRGARRPGPLRAVHERGAVPGQRRRKRGRADEHVPRQPRRGEARVRNRGPQPAARHEEHRG